MDASETANIGARENLLMQKITVAMIMLVFTLVSFAKEEQKAVRIMTDGFNCSEGIVIANQIRDMVNADSLLKSYTSGDSTYIIVEITSFKDGSTSVINASFSTVTPLQKNKLDYHFTRRLVSNTLTDMKEISFNILEKIHLIRKS